MRKEIQKGMVKNVGGRPPGRETKYEPRYCEEIIRFFNVKPQTVKMKQVVTKQGEIVEVEVFETTPLPTFTRFAANIDIDDDTVRRWSRRYPPFARAYEKARRLQESLLVENVLLNRYNPVFAIFFAKNKLGYRDKTETEISTKMNVDSAIAEIEATRKVAMKTNVQATKEIKQHFKIEEPKKQLEEAKKEQVQPIE